MLVLGAGNRAGICKNQPGMLESDEIPERRSLTLAPGSLKQALSARSAEGVLFRAESNQAVRCTACAHRCFIANGSAGSCGVRFNADGVLRVPHGYVARRYVRAVETNTVFHVLPGARSLTFGMYGCDLRCPYCHNHRISQALRDGESAERPVDIDAEALVDEAVSAGCRVLCAAYNEPMISAEWTRTVFAAGKRRGLVTALISDGNTTREALSYVREVSDVFRVDLKGASEGDYKKLGGRFHSVLDGIQIARELGFWVELVTLIVPGLNQDFESVRSLARTIKDIDPNIPWHLNGFVPRYRLEHLPPADRGFLISAAGSAYAAGLRFVYVGNVNQDALSQTRCPECHTALVERRNYETLENRLDDGRCPTCKHAIPGIWRAA